MVVLLFIVMILLVIVGNASGKWLKADLRKRGYKTYWYKDHIADLFNAKKVISETQDFQLKQKYRRAILSILIVYLLMIVTWVTLLNYL